VGQWRHRLYALVRFTPHQRRALAMHVTVPGPTALLVAALPWPCPTRQGSRSDRAAFAPGGRVRARTGSRCAWCYARALSRHDGRTRPYGGSVRSVAGDGVAWLLDSDSTDPGPPPC